MKKLNTNSVDKVEPLLFMLKCEMVRGSANSHFSLNLIPGKKTDRFFPTSEYSSVLNKNQHLNCRLVEFWHLTQLHGFTLRWMFLTDHLRHFFTFLLYIIRQRFVHLGQQPWTLTRTQHRTFKFSIDFRSTFVVSPWNNFHHRLVDGWILYIYILALIWIKKLVSLGSKDSDRETYRYLITLPYKST